MAKHSNSLDVARLAGVSQTTVSFVLNDRPGHAISEETRERVFLAARQLQYRSNRLSNGLFRGASGLVGVVLPSANDDYFASILTAVSLFCAQNGKSVIFSPLHDEHHDKRAPLLRLIEYRVDGIILICQQPIVAELNELVGELIDKHMRCVVVDDRKYEDKVPCVVSDDVSGARQVVSYLASLGHRRIAHISAGSEFSTAVDRHNGFVQGMAELGVSQDQLLIEGHSYLSVDGKAAARKLLNGPEVPTAIFAANDTLAAEVLKEMRHLGLSCPKDISVVGYGNTQVADALDLTSVEQHPVEIGRTAIAHLLDQWDGGGGIGSASVLDCELIVRETSGPVRSE